MKVAVSVWNMCIEGRQAGKRGTLQGMWCVCMGVLPVSVNFVWDLWGGSGGAGCVGLAGCYLCGWCWVAGCASLAEV